MSARLHRLVGARWPDLLKRTGVSNAALSGKHVPCPLCGGIDRFRFDNLEGRGTWICNRCGAGDGIALVSALLSINYGSTITLVEEMLKECPGDAWEVSAPGPLRANGSNLERAMRFWDACFPITPHSPPARYLRSRSLWPSPLAELRYQPAAWYVDGSVRLRLPVLAAALRGMDGKLVNVQRIFLDSSGRQAKVANVKKYMSGPIPRGSAVRLAEHCAELAIAEGVETALSVTALFGLPCWAATSAHLLASWSPPQGVETVVVVADHDASGVGLSAADKLAHHLRNDGLRVITYVPVKEGFDANDVLRAVGRAALPVVLNEFTER